MGPGHTKSHGGIRAAAHSSEAALCRLFLYQSHGISYAIAFQQPVFQTETQHLCQCVRLLPIDELFYKTQIYRFLSHLQGIFSIYLYLDPLFAPVRIQSVSSALAWAAPSWILRAFVLSRNRQFPPFCGSLNPGAASTAPVPYPAQNSFVDFVISQGI